MKTIENIKVGNYTGITTDSTMVKKGYIFVCIKGFSHDGHDFAQQAVEKGATLVVASKTIILEVPVVYSDNCRKAAAYLSDKFYNNPSSKVKLVGITGTNGKSSICFLTYKLLTNLGYRVGAIGTGKYLIAGKEYKSERTTPDIVELRFILAKMVKKKVDFVLMEVSSHAIALHRVAFLKFDIACFTNLSQDHLDFHKSMQEYADTKLGFLQEVVKSGGIALMNEDDKYVSTLALPRVKGLSNLNKSADYFFEKEEVSLAGCKFLLNGKKCVSNLLGEVNLFNSAFILSLTDLLLGEVFCEKLRELKPLAGRYNLLFGNILVDYAHSPDSLERVITFAKNQHKRRVITLFGCGGDRDKKKRPLMGKLAIELSDFVIICEDNSRKEDVENIITEIIEKVDLSKVLIIKDRQKAIDYGLSLCSSEDLFLVLGRGTEPILDRGYEKLSFSDLEYLQNKTELTFQKVFDPFWISSILESQFSQKFVPNFIFEHISTDSRNIKPKSLFFALPGKKFDSYQFLDDVVKADGCCAVVGRDCSKKSKQFLVVDNPLHAYQKVAKAYLANFAVKKIGITGSVGKTTTKEMLYNLLKQDGLTLKTKENENNQIGVPKTIFNLHSKHKYLLIEMGTDHPGEIERVAKIVEPDIGIITNISGSHLSAFGDKQGVYREKKNLFDYSKEKLTADKDFFENSIKYEYTKKNDKFWITVDGLSFLLGNQPKFRIQSAAMSIKTALLLGLDEKAIQRGLLEPLELSNRLECKTIGGVHFIFDSYNANPLSMREAIAFWQNYKKAHRHFAILGDMLDLGKNACDFHLDIGKLLNNDFVYGIGDLAQYYHPKYHYKNVKEFQKELPFFVKDDVVLIKGSNGMGLSILKDIFTKKLEG